MSEEDQYSDDELERARALALALEQPAAAADPALREALAAAETLRQAVGLDAEREAAVFDATRARIAERARRRRRARYITAAAVAASSLAAAALLWLPARREAPAPAVDLRAAQLGWLAAETTDNAQQLERELRAYRAQYFAELNRRYTP
ncbi:MAG TPA: hypothetical protein VJV78_43640 [Polyangiales bacterium]|nr:hypothetical protein [Polyangiales bacterium]